MGTNLLCKEAWIHFHRLVGSQYLYKGEDVSVRRSVTGSSLIERCINSLVSLKMTIYIFILQLNTWNLSKTWSFDSFFSWKLAEKVIIPSTDPPKIKRDSPLSGCANNINLIFIGSISPPHLRVNYIAGQCSKINTICCYVRPLTSINHCFCDGLSIQKFLLLVSSLFVINYKLNRAVFRNAIELNLSHGTHSGISLRLLI